MHFPRKMILDACVFLSVINTLDSNHDKSIKFFDDWSRHVGAGNSSTLIVPANALFEVNATVRRKKTAGEWHSFPTVRFGGVETYPLNETFLHRVQSSDVFDLTNGLKGQDAIYAAIAILENIPLASFDNDFIILGKNIDFRNLNTEY